MCFARSKVYKQTLTNCNFTLLRLLPQIYKILTYLSFPFYFVNEELMLRSPTFIKFDVALITKMYLTDQKADEGLFSNMADQFVWEFHINSEKCTKLSRKTYVTSWIHVIATWEEQSPKVPIFIKFSHSQSIAVFDLEIIQFCLRENCRKSIYVKVLIIEQNYQFPRGMEITEMSIFLERDLATLLR